MATYYVNGKPMDGNAKLSQHFTVREFASKGTNDSKEIKINPKLIRLLEQLRVGLGKPMTITSGYRSPKHNSNVGGAKNSHHVQGNAADIVVSGYTPYQVACYARGLGFTGVAHYSSFTHVDVRPGGFVTWGLGKKQPIKSVPLGSKVSNVTVADIGSPGGSGGNGVPAGSVAEDGYLKNGSTGESVKKLQQHLSQTGFFSGSADGVFGPSTEAAVKSLQKAGGLKADGVVGDDTWAALANAYGGKVEVSPVAPSGKKIAPGKLLDGHLFVDEYTPEEIQEHLTNIYKKAPKQVQNRDSNNGQRIKTATEYLMTHYVNTSIK